MGKKYVIDAFNYPYRGIEKEVKTGNIVMCIFYFIKLSIKYDGVDVYYTGRREE